MTIRQGEIGKEIYVGTGFDMSSNTLLELKFVSPDGTVTFTRNSTTDGITAPATPSPDIPGVGILAANEYMLYESQADDFAHESGDWCVEARYTEGSTKYYIGAPGTLVVSDDCVTG